MEFVGPDAFDVPAELTEAIVNTYETPEAKFPVAVNGDPTPA